MSVTFVMGLFTVNSCDIFIIAWQGKTISQYTEEADSEMVLHCWVVSIAISVTRDSYSIGNHLERQQ
jgi:hypothetical protein